MAGDSQEEKDQMKRLIPVLIILFLIIIGKKLYKNKKQFEFLAFEESENFDYTTYLENSRQRQIEKL